MERLTRRSENGTAVYSTPSGDPMKWENNRHNVLQKLAEYEDLKEQNRLLTLPVSVGDNVWFWNKDTDPIEEAPLRGYVSGYEIESANSVYIVINPIGEFSWLPHYERLEIEDFGKTIFLTESEAVVALQESKEKS